MSRLYDTRFAHNPEGMRHAELLEKKVTASMDPERVPMKRQDRLGRLLRFKWSHSRPAVSSPTEAGPAAEVAEPQSVEPQFVQQTTLDQQIVESPAAQLQAEEADSAQRELFASSPEMDAALDIAVRAAVLNTGATGIAIGLIEKKRLVCRARLGDIAPNLGVPLNVSEGITGACVRTANVLICSDTQADKRVNAELCRMLGIRSILVVPILISRSVVGILEALSSTPESFTPNHSRRLQRIATYIAGLALDAARSSVPEAVSSKPPDPSNSLAGAQVETPENTSLNAFRDALKKIGPKSSWEDISQELVFRLQDGHKS